MSNFDVELRALVDGWVKRGADILAMYDALRDEAERLAGEQEKVG